MGSNTSKAQLLDDLKDEQTQWEALLQDIGEEYMTQPGVAGEWSIKDIVAHLTTYRHRTVGRFQAALRHEPAPTPPWPPHLQTDDEINEWIYTANRDRPLVDVLGESRDVFQQLMETLVLSPKRTCSTPRASRGWRVSHSAARHSSPTSTRSMSRTCGRG